MPKIPTFETRARPTTEVGAVKSGVQVPLSQTLAGALQPITEYAIKSKQASDLTEAQVIKNNSLEEISEIVRTSGNISDPITASQTFSQKYKDLVNQKLSNIKNNNVRKLIQNSFLEDEYKFRYQVLNSSGKLLEKKTVTTLDATTTNEIATALSTGNKDIIKQLPERLSRYYDKYNSVDPSLVDLYKQTLPKKITIASFYDNLTKDPVRTLESFDQGAYPLLKGEERVKYRNKALSEITKRTTLLEKQITFQSAQMFQQKWQSMFSGNLSEDDLISDGSLSGLPVLQKQMVELNKNIQNKKVTDTPDFDDVISITKKILNGEVKNLTDTFRNGFEFTSKSILERSDKFSKESYNTFAKIFQNIEDPEFVDQHKKFFDFIDKASLAVKSNPNFKSLDATYNKRLDVFYNEMYKRFNQGIQEKKNTADLLNPKSKEYIAKDLIKFIPDSAEIMKGLYQGVAVNEEIKSKTPQRLPNESVADYLKRIGQ